MNDHRLKIAAQMMAAIIQGSGCVDIKVSRNSRFEHQFTVTGSTNPSGYDTISQIAVAMADSLIEAEEESR